MKKIIVAVLGLGLAGLSFGSEKQIIKGDKQEDYPRTIPPVKVERPTPKEPVKSMPTVESVIRKNIFKKRW